MGLGLRFSAFHRTSPDRLWSTIEEFFHNKNRQICAELPDRRTFPRWDFYEPANEWTILDVGYTASVQDRTEWRELMSFITRELAGVGFIFFVYDGDYWGYELENNGLIVDQFVQFPDEGAVYWPTDTDLSGNPSVLTRFFPWLSKQFLAPYLIQKPSPNMANIRQEVIDLGEAWDIKPHPTDEFTRGNECAILDFLKALRIPVRSEDNYVRFTPKLHRSIWMSRKAI